MEPHKKKSTQNPKLDAPSLFENPDDQKKKAPVLLLTAEEKEEISREDEQFQEVLEKRRQAGYID